MRRSDGALFPLPFNADLSDQDAKLHALLFGVQVALEQFCQSKGHLHQADTLSEWPDWWELISWMGRRMGEMFWRFEVAMQVDCLRDQLEVETGCTGLKQG